MKITKFTFPLVILNLTALILITFGLPDIVPLQIGLTGTVNLSGSKWYIPLIGIIPIFIAVIYKLHIEYLQENLNKNIENKIIPAIAIIVIPLTWIPAFLALSLSNNVTTINSSSNLPLIHVIGFISIILGILFIVIGYYIKNLKQNRLAGIRTTWTLKNELVWKKTHKIGSYTFMIGGLALLVCALATSISENLFYSIVGWIIAIVLAIILPIIYSYCEYNKIKS